MKRPVFHSDDRIRVIAASWNDGLVDRLGTVLGLHGEYYTVRLDDALIVRGGDYYFTPFEIVRDSPIDLLASLAR